MRGARYNVLMERGWNDDSHVPIKETSYDDLILMRKEFVCIFFVWNRSLFLHRNTEIRRMVASLEQPSS